jgi:SSS family solute:Na+ symporter
VDTPTKLIDNFAYTEGSFFWIVNHVFFQYYSLLIFLVSAIVMIIVSYFSEEPDYAKISGLTYGTTSADHQKESRSSWTGLDVFFSVLLLVFIVAAYMYFTG